MNISEYNDFEKQFTFLQKIDTAALTIEECVHYCIAVIEVLQKRLTYYLKFRNYRKAQVVEAELEVYKKHILQQLQLLGNPAADLKSFLALKATEPNYYRELAQTAVVVNEDPSRSSIVLSLKDVENNIRTILFGVSYDLSFDGYGFVLRWKAQLDPTNESNFKRLEQFCKEHNFKWTQGDNHKKFKKILDDSHLVTFIEILPLQSVKKATK